MNQNNESSSEATTEPSVTGQRPGPMLREARLRADLSTAQVAHELRLEERIVIALEADDHDNLPGTTYVRGYLRGYARLVNIPVDTLIPKASYTAPQPPAKLPTIIQHNTQARLNDTPVRAMTWFVSLVIVLLVLMWWHNSNLQPLTSDAVTGSVAETPLQGGKSLAADGGDDQPTIPAASLPVTAVEPAQESPSMVTPAPQTTASGQPSGPPLSAETPDAAEPSSPGSSPVDETSTTADDAGAMADPESATTTGTATTTPATAGAAAETEQETGPDTTLPQSDAAPEQATATGPARLQLTIGGDSWIDIRDADQKRLYFNLATEGDVLDLSGRLPFKVLIGNARDVRARLNDRPFDLKPYMVKGVARFKLQETDR